MVIRILIADDFELLRSDLRQTLDAQPDMRVRAYWVSPAG